MTIEEVLKEKGQLQEIESTLQKIDVAFVEKRRKNASRESQKAKEYRETVEANGQMRLPETETWTMPKEEDL